MKVLVIGGAGFIGSHLVDALVGSGHDVRVFDNLTPQVHGADQSIPAYLNSNAEFILGDIRDRVALSRALEGVEVVFHQASVVGVGQSMYEVHRYMDVNTSGSAMLLDILVNHNHSVRKLVVASSMSVYGEGQYICDNCGLVYPKLRSETRLVRGEWEMTCPTCGVQVNPVTTDENKLPAPASIYAISKRDQEEMCICIGRAYGIPTVVLRYFNVYGPRQTLSNPYTGVLAIFSARLLNGQPPVIYEDGRQSRDYIHVSDIVQANLLAMDNGKVEYEIFNVGTGQPLTVLDVANALCQALRSGIEPQITDRFRTGDIRHCYADISKIQEILGFIPKIGFEEGIADLLSWVREQKPKDLFEQAQRELAERNLLSSVTSTG